MGQVFRFRVWNVMLRVQVVVEWSGSGVRKENINLNLELNVFKVLDEGSECGLIFVLRLKDKEYGLTIVNSHWFQ